MGIVDGCVNGEADRKIHHCGDGELAKNMSRQAPDVDEELQAHISECGSSFTPIRAISNVNWLPVLKDNEVQYEAELLFSKAK